MFYVDDTRRENFLYRTLLEERQSQIPQYNMKCRGTPDTTWNIPRSITFSLLHFMLYCGKLIIFGTVYDAQRGNVFYVWHSKRKCYLCMKLEEEMFSIYSLTLKGNFFFVGHSKRSCFQWMKLGQIFLRKVFLLEEELVQVKTGATMRKSRKIS